ASVLRLPPVHRVLEASVSDLAHQPRETSRQEGRQKTEVVDAIQKRRLKHVDEKAVKQDRNDAPERHAKRCLPNGSERKFSEVVPDSPGQAKQQRQQPSQQPRDRDREQPPEPLRE